MDTGCCGQLRHVVRVCLSIRCEVKWLLLRSLWSCSFVLRWCGGAGAYACRRRKRMVLLRRRLQAFYDCEEDDLCEIVSAIDANPIIGSPLQHWLVWIRNRCQAFTDITASWDDLKWKINFRVNRAAFRYLCTSLSANLQRSTVVCVPISVEKRIANALWRLGTNVEYRTISHLFGVSISTVCIIVHEVCKSKKYIKIPTGPQAMGIVRGFEERWDFPQCFGAIDGSHIPIIAPTHTVPQIITTIVKDFTPLCYRH